MQTVVDFRTARSTISGSFHPYLVATLHFDSLDATRTAFATEIGRSCAADRRLMAPNDEDVQMFLFDDGEI